MLLLKWRVVDLLGIAAWVIGLVGVGLTGYSYFTLDQSIIDSQGRRDSLVASIEQAEQDSEAIIAQADEICQRITGTADKIVAVLNECLRGNFDNLAEADKFLAEGSCADWARYSIPIGSDTLQWTVESLPQISSDRVPVLFVLRDNTEEAHAYVCSMYELESGLLCNTIYGSCLDSIDWSLTVDGNTPDTGG